MGLSHGKESRELRRLLRKVAGGIRKWKHPASLAPSWRSPRIKTVERARRAIRFAVKACDPVLKGLFYKHDNLA